MRIEPEVRLDQFLPQGVELMTMCPEKTPSVESNHRTINSREREGSYFLGP